MQSPCRRAGTSSRRSLRTRVATPPIVNGGQERLAAQSAGGCGFGLDEDGEDAELAHEAEGVPTDAGVDDLAVGEVVDADAFDGDFFIGGTNSHELAFVSAGNRP